VVDRKPFGIKDHLAALGAAGITESKMELKAQCGIFNGRWGGRLAPHRLDR
jgi:hypothetical protein